MPCLHGGVTWLGVTCLLGGRLTCLPPPSLSPIFLSPSLSPILLLSLCGEHARQHAREHTRLHLRLNARLHLEFERWRVEEDAGVEEDLACAQRVVGSWSCAAPVRVRAAVCERCNDVFRYVRHAHIYARGYIGIAAWSSLLEEQHRVPLLE